MKVKKTLCIILLASISLFTVACNKYNTGNNIKTNTKEYIENDTEKSTKDNEDENNNNTEEIYNDNLNSNKDDIEDNNENDNIVNDNNIANDIKEEEKEGYKTNEEMERFSMTTFNTVPEFCEYILDKLDVTKMVGPTKSLGNGSYYIRKNENNICIDIVMQMKSLKNETKMAKEIMDVKVKINDKYYSTFSLVETLNNYYFEETTRVKPLETRKVHYIAEIPISEYNESMDVILTVNNKDYYNNFNLKGVTF